MESLKGKKAVIEYPCTWKYKIIAQAEHDIELIAREIIASKEYVVQKSNNSNKGKYKSYNLSFLVQSDDERIYYYEELKKHEKIKMVL